MKKCKNCGGAIDDKGKCLACGSVNEMKLGNEDGVIKYGIPEEIKKHNDLVASLTYAQAYMKGKDNV